MANGNLIQGARRLGQSKRFVDYGKVLGEAMKPTRGMLLAKQQYFQAIKEKEVKTQNFIDNLSDLDLTKIPTGLRNQVTDFLTTGRQKYYDASERAANAKMGSEEYRDAVREMNNVNNSFRNLSGGLDNLLERRKEFLADKDANNISNGDITDSKYYDNLSILGADLNDPNALTLSISESGDVGFIIKGIDGNDKVINEIPNWNNKASATSDSLAKMSEAYNKDGQRGIEVTDQILKDNVYRTIGDNRSNIVSLATDSWLGAPALINESNVDTELYQGLTGAELLDPANQAALKSYVNERYYNGIKDAYSSGYGVYDKRKNPKTDTDTNSSISKSLRKSSIVAMGDPTAPVGYSSYEEFYADEKFKDDKERNAYLNEKGVRTLENTEKIEKSNLNYANRLTTLLNAPRYGRQFNIYLSRDELVREVLQNEDQFEARGIIDSSDTQAALKFVKENYGDGYLYSYKKDQGPASMQVIPIDAFAEEDPYIDALLTGSDAIDENL